MASVILEYQISILTSYLSFQKLNISESTLFVFQNLQCIQQFQI